MAFPPIILLLLYSLLLAALRHTHYVMLQIYKQYMQTLKCIRIPFCLLLFVIGMSFQSKLEILRASIVLRKSINVNISTPPRYYNTGKRLDQIYHARLRTSCSSLRQHLFSKRITDSPQCVCCSIEDTHHYLFVILISMYYSWRSVLIVWQK